MPERGYTSHLAIEAVAFVTALPKAKQRSVLDLADQLARHPFQVGDYRTTDANGRTIENLLIGDWHFSFWVDHATREVRITEIVRV